MIKKFRSEIDYVKTIRGVESKAKKIFYYLTTGNFIKKQANNMALIELKIDTCEHCLPLEEMTKIITSMDIIIKNICFALGYDENDVNIRLVEAGSGCFFIKIGLSIVEDAIKKYTTGFIEGMLNKNLEDEGRRQAEVIKELFLKLVTTPKLKNAETKEAQNIHEARKTLYMTFDNNKKIKKVQFIDAPNETIKRGVFMDYIV